ncbi:MAG: serine/threonine-protein kinase [Pirellulales bacterium]
MELKCCSLESLQRLLDHQLEAEEESVVLRHLNSCATCQQNLESLTAEPQFWNQLESSLRESDARPVNEKSSNEVVVVGIPNAANTNHTSHLKTQPAPNRTAHEFPCESHLAEGPAVEHAASLQFVQQWLAPSEDPQYIGRLGAYDIAGVIGVGGMGIVLKGFDRSLHRSVAIKVLGSHLTASGAARKRFEREAQAAASVVHENVLAIHAIDQWREIPYFVMPLIRGESLEKRLKRTGPLELVEILRIARQIAAGLSAAHQQGVVHRDIKPANVLMEHGSERLKISDFGLARAGDDASLTRSGYIMGTPLYMSPEQARGERVDARSDIFSFGSLLYALCTGHPPFRAETPYGVIRRLCEEQPRQIQQYSPTVPLWLSGLIAKMMEKEIDNRISSAAELQEIFTIGLAHSQVPFYTALPNELRRFVTESDDPHQAQRNGRLLAWASITALVGFMSLAAVGVWGWSNRDTDSDKQMVAKETLPKVSGNLQNNSDNSQQTGAASQPFSELAVNNNATNVNSSLPSTRDDSELTQQNSMLRAALDPPDLTVQQPHTEKQASQPEKSSDASSVVLTLPTTIPAYRFQADEKVSYEIRLELSSETNSMEIVGQVELQVVETLENAAELNYQLQFNHKLTTRAVPSDRGELTGPRSNASDSNDVKVRSGNEWPGFAPEIPVFGPQFGPRFGPSFGGPFGASSTQPFSFEASEMQSCENSGRAKVSYTQGYLGASHTSELPGQLGPLLGWIFPALGKTGNDGLLRSEARLRINGPDPNSPENWSLRKAVEVIRSTELQPRKSDPNRPAQYSLSVADRLVADDKPAQTLLGTLLFEIGSGKLVQLELARSVFDDDELIHNSKIRELKLTIKKR